MTTRRIDEIIIGERHRKDLGDIDGLAASIRELGLLQLPVVRPDGRLIDGQRRIEAAKLLGWSEIPIHVVDIDAVVRGEFAANACRKDFLPSELVAIGREVERVERERAKEREREGGRRKGSGKLPDPEKGDSRDKIAKQLGISGRTYEKARPSSRRSKASLKGLAMSPPSWTATAESTAPIGRCTAPATSSAFSAFSRTRASFERSWSTCRGNTTPIGSAEVPRNTR
jgi:hypothetical protein